MRKIGAHLSIAGGLSLAIKRAQELQVNALQIFLKNASQWKAKPYAEGEIKAFKEAWLNYADLDIFAHCGYLINPAGQGENRARGIDALKDELFRAGQLGINFLVLHPGNHKGVGYEKGVHLIVSALDQAYEESGSDVTLLLETTAGQGTSIGHRFEHLGEIISQSKYRKHLGVCLDTCHIHAAGYDFSTEESLDSMLDQFKNFIGLEKLMLLHINDSKKELGSSVDRHEHIGEGTIGLKAFSLLLHDSRLIKVPAILETPKDDETDDRKNLNTIKNIMDSTLL